MAYWKKHLSVGSFLPTSPERLDRYRSPKCFAPNRRANCVRLGAARSPRMTRRQSRMGGSAAQTPAATNFGDGNPSPTNSPRRSMNMGFLDWLSAHAIRLFQQAPICCGRLWLGDWNFASSYLVIRRGLAPGPESQKGSERRIGCLRRLWRKRRIHTGKAWTDRGPRKAFGKAGARHAHILLIGGLLKQNRISMSRQERRARVCGTRPRQVKSRVGSIARTDCAYFSKMIEENGCGFQRRPPFRWVEGPRCHAGCVAIQYRNFAGGKDLCGQTSRTAGQGTT